MQRLLFIIVLMLTYGGLASSKPPARPKLFVGIVVDQMREDFLLRYYDQYGNDGFKRLIKEGAVCRNVHCNYTPTITAVGHASLYSGTTPRYHGIIGNSWYNRDKRQTIYCVADSSEKVIGNEQSSPGISPRNLLPTNLSDELEIATQGKARVLSISIKDRAAVLSAGHMADGAFWLDLTTGNFVTTSFYMPKLPDWLIQFNKTKKAFQYLDQQWNLLLPEESYSMSMPDDNSYEIVLNGKDKPVFPYNLKELAPLNSPYFEVLNRSPFSNTLLTDLAVEILKTTGIGRGFYTDLLEISFSATDPVGHTYGPASKELHDTYVRLDRELARLLKALDTYIGKGNYALFLTSDHGVGENPFFLVDNKIPAGSLNEQNLYENALHYLNNKLGDGNWIVAFRNDQFYLNRDLIQEKGLNLSQIQDMLAAFLLTQEGIAETYTATQLMKQEYTGFFASKIQQGFNFKLSGDVKYIMEPGWYANMGKGATHNTAYNYDSQIPLIFYGFGIRKKTSYQYHTITDIAPTVSTLLKIKFPSSATGTPIQEVLEE
ncbi:MAG: alkaline phosphatase family protein [Bacteroidales bacterium]|nr:alkaline phosphatase family protein [Bacteroidales bacterium]